MNNINELFLIFYDRPASYEEEINAQEKLKKEGLENLINDFTASDEFKSVYQGDMKDKLNTLYQNVFNRNIDSEGLNCYLNKASEENIGKLFYDIVSSANGDDKKFFEEKLKSFEEFTDVLQKEDLCIKYDDIKDYADNIDMLINIKADIEDYTHLYVANHAFVCDNTTDTVSDNGINDEHLNLINDMLIF